MFIRNPLILLALLFAIACREAKPGDQSGAEELKENKAHLSPEERYGDLFQAVQLGEVFPDSKTFVDCMPRYTTDEIIRRYEKEKQSSGFSLARFVKDNFDLPVKYKTEFVSDTARSVADHINALWPVLTRQADTLEGSTLLSLPKPYVVPGGRFGEVYYWDSYFTILGLQTAGKIDMIENMVDNFSSMIEREGYIPNGNRTYFLGRSQPPFFSLMVKTLAEAKGDKIYLKYLPALEKEYQFWMEGLSNLSVSQPTHRRLVLLGNGAILNRYWDDRPLPRPESYREDVALAKDIQRPEQDLYRDIRAACESGWDFSSRWFKDGQYLASIHTTDLIPVDLNALLFHLESVLAKAYGLEGDTEQATLYQQRGQQRFDAIQFYCWDGSQQFFVDYDHVQRKASQKRCLAGMFPLYFGLSTQQQANQVAQIIEKEFLQAGGVVTSSIETGQQWDAPNGWAPLQWISIQGLRNYNAVALADSIKKRWVKLNEKVYQQTGKLTEKYNVVDLSLPAGGGEYPLQDGFGWTNGVLLKLLAED